MPAVVGRQVVGEEITARDLLPLRSHHPVLVVQQLFDGCQLAVLHQHCRLVVLEEAVRDGLQSVRDAESRVAAWAVMEGNLPYRPARTGAGAYAGVPDYDVVTGEFRRERHPRLHLPEGLEEVALSPDLELNLVQLLPVAPFDFSGVGQSPYRLVAQ